jgi:hypothetical protein
MIIVVIHRNSIAGHIEESRRECIEEKTSTMDGGHRYFGNRRVVARNWYVFRAHA